MIQESKITSVRMFFKKRGIDVLEKVLDDYYVFYGGYAVGKDGNETMMFRFILEEKDPWLRMIVNFPVVEVNEETVLRISELLSRVNFRLTFGRFEMNFDNGQVRFTSCQDASVLEAKEKDAVLERQIVRAIAISHRFYPYLKRVCSGESPRDVGAAFRNEKA